MEKKYPVRLFLLGFSINLITGCWFFFFPAIIFLIIGFWFTPCLWIGIALLLLDIVISCWRQLQIRRMILQDSQNPDFDLFREAVLSPDWSTDIQELVNKKISNASCPEGSDEENESTLQNK